MSARTFPSTRAIEVFISSIPSRDGELRDELLHHLNPLVRSGQLSLWCDAQINAGTGSDQVIVEHLQAAEVILLLVSPESIASPDCYQQMLRAVERHNTDRVNVISILLRPIVDWPNLPAGKLTTLPVNGKPVTVWRERQLAWFEVVQTLHTFVFPQSSSYNEQPSPTYRNVIKRPPSLHPKTILKRPKAVKEIYKRLTHPETTALILTGMAGLGKSVLASQVYSYASEQQSAGKGPLTGEPLWLDIDATITLVDVAASLSQALKRPLPSLRDLTAHDLASELCALLYSSDAPRLIVLNQFETWLDPQTHSAREELSGVGAWLDMLNKQAFSDRLLLTSHFFPRGTNHTLGQYVQKYDVQELSEAEGQRLLRMGGTTVSEEDLRLAVAHYRGHPMALSIFCSLLAEKRSISIATLLSDPHYRYRWSNEMHTLLHYIYTQQLKLMQRELLQAFAIYREAVPLRAALVIVENSVPPDRSVAALDVLLELHLLQSSDGPHYQLHPVVADFLEAHTGDSDVQTVAHIRADAHIKAAHYYQDLSMQGQMTRDFLPEERPQRMNDVHNLIEAAWHLCRGNHRQDAYQLIQETDLFAYLHRWGHNDILLEMYTQLVASKAWQPEAALAARLHNEMGEIYTTLGLHNEAPRSFSLALKYARETGQAEPLVHILNNLGAAYRVSGQYSRALDCYQEALHICDTSSQKIVGRGETLNNLGIVTYEQGLQQERQGDIDQAKTYYQRTLAYYTQALTLHQEDNLPEEEAITLNNIGDVYAGLEQSAEAHEYYWRALKSFQKYNARRGEGLVLNNLGVLYRELGQETTAQEYYYQALRIFREVGDRWQEGKVLRNLGRCYFLQEPLEAQRRYTLCLAHFLLAKNVFEQIGRASGEILPRWIEDIIRAELGSLRFAALLKDVEPEAARIVERAQSACDV